MDFKNKESDPAKFISSDELCEMYKGFVADAPVVSIEDPFDQDDWAGWTKLTEETDIQIVGDDLTVTNPKRIQTAVEKKACNCLLLKVNQIGSVTESIAAHNLAKENGNNRQSSIQFGMNRRIGFRSNTFICPRDMFQKCIGIRLENQMVCNDITI